MDFLKHIAGSFSTITPTSTFIIILVILLIAWPIYILRDTIAELLKGWFSFKKVKPRKVIEAQYHDIFNVVDQVKSTVSSIEYTTKGIFSIPKTTLIIELINTQLTETKNALYGLISKDGIDTMDNQQLKYEVIQAIKIANETYNEKVYLKFLEMGVTASDAEFLLKEYAKFRDDVFEGFIERVESISSNDVYTTNFHRISASFEVIAMGLYLIARDSKYTCSLINGRFKNYEF